MGLESGCEAQHWCKREQKQRRCEQAGARQARQRHSHEQGSQGRPAEKAEGRVDIASFQDHTGWERG